MGMDEAHQRTLCWIDSDFDTEDDQYADDIEEMISNQQFIQPNGLELYCSEESSDDIAQVEALSRFEPKRRKTTVNSFQQHNRENRDKKRKAMASSLIDTHPFIFPTFQQASPALAKLAELKSQSDSKNRGLEESIIKFNQKFLNHAAGIVSQERDQQFESKQISSQQKSPFEKSYIFDGWLPQQA